MARTAARIAGRWRDAVRSPLVPVALAQAVVLWIAFGVGGFFFGFLELAGAFWVGRVTERWREVLAGVLLGMLIPIAGTGWSGFDWVVAGVFLLLFFTPGYLLGSATRPSRGDVTDSVGLRRATQARRAKVLVASLILGVTLIFFILLIMVLSNIGRP